MNFSKFQDPALLFLRLVIAAIFLYAGYAKLFFWTGGIEGMSPGMMNLMKFLSIVEPIGAVALIIGFLTRWAALGLAIIMVGAAFFLRLAMNAPVFTSPTASGLDYVLLILAGCLVLVAFGGGKWALQKHFVQ